ncbi:MAG: hypothetical protein KDB25_08040 [Leucobacter sp.]|nr:hypothetical protein [Leucobacter sp.]
MVQFVLLGVWVLILIGGFVWAFIRFARYLRQSAEARIRHPDQLSQPPESPDPGANPVQDDGDPSIDPDLEGYINRWYM